MQHHTSHANWDTVIRPQNSLFELPLRDLWHYRDLLVLFVRRDFVSFYKQTILGPLWFFVQPIFTTVIYTFIFGNLAGISTDGLPKPLFYLAGITCWNYFAECLNKTSTVFKDNANIFGKVYFPRLIMPLSIVASNLIKFLVQFALFVMALVYYKFMGANFDITFFAILFPYLVLLMALQGLGLGMIISALTTKYRDLSFLVTFGVQLLMYATTVIYPLSTAPEKYKWLISLNPMTTIIETFRYGFLGQGDFSWFSLGVCSAVTFGITLIGVLIFNKVEKTFIDTV
ncbi:MAG: ABC transporter permease [Sphingobacteriales bacterium]|nr:MAG: ABC transporter permease [Sphingobacteriales bacterium]